MYQALYRKYRPKNFNEVSGQKNIIDTIGNAIISDKLSHAYLFSGPRGTGKTSIAKIIAKLVNCNDRKGLECCNSCVNCTQNTTDIIEIDAASNNGVDEIRELKNKISLVPSYGKYKIYIIDEVHMLTINAFNALLKTLEEPPKYIIFILATTEPHKIPATILSRCQHFEFKKIDIASIVSKLRNISDLENINIDDESLYEIARICDGGMRDAINMLDQANSYSNSEIKISNIHEINGTITQYDIEELLNHYFDADLNFVLNKISYYNNSGKNLIKMAEEIMFYLRNVLIYQKAPDYFNENNFISKDAYINLSQRVDTADVLKLVYEFNSCINNMKISNNPQLELELIFIKNINFNSKRENIFEKEPAVTMEKPDAATFKNNEKKVENISKEIIKKQDFYLISKEIRIDNTLARFDKKNLLKVKQDILNVKPLLINPKYSQFVSVILDGMIRAASDEYLIFVYKTEADSNLFNENIAIIEKILDEAKVGTYKVISVNNNEWDKIKIQFNSKNKKYIYKPEIIEENNFQDNRDKITNLFGSIVEYK